MRATELRSGRKQGEHFDNFEVAVGAKSQKGGALVDTEA